VERVLPRRELLDAGFAIMKMDTEGTALYDVQELIKARDVEYEVHLEPG
jgi:hypothetical protein